jgi:hypothetical protein
MALDAEFLEDGIALRLLNGGPENDEILLEEILEFGVFKKLLTEQSAAPSGVGREVEQDFFVFGLGRGHGFVQGALEKDLGRSQRGQKKHD